MSGCFFSNGLLYVLPEAVCRVFLRRVRCAQTPGPIRKYETDLKRKRISIASLCKEWDLAEILLVQLSLVFLNGAEKNVFDEKKIFSLFFDQTELEPDPPLQTGNIVFAPRLQIIESGSPSPADLRVVLQKDLLVGDQLLVRRTGLLGHGSI